MNRKFLYIMLVCLAAIAASCSSKTEKAKTGREALTIALTPTIDCLPFYVAQKTGIDASFGYALNLQTHSSRSDCDTALIHGMAHAIMTDSIRANDIRNRLVTLASAADTIPLTAADSLQFSYHDNIKIFFFTNSKSRLKRPSQLADKMIAIDRGSVEMLIAQQLLDSLKISDKAFLVQMQNIRTRNEMLSAGSMDAVALTEPQAAVARSQRHNVIYTADAYRGKSLGCLLSASRHAAIRNIYNAAVDSINKHGIHHYDTIIASCMDIPVQCLPLMSKQKLYKLK